MTNEKIIELGTTLGLNFNRKTNFEDQLKRNTVVFDGCNGQRFLIRGEWKKEYILKEMGKSLILMGRRQMKLEHHRLMNPMSD